MHIYNGKNVCERVMFLLKGFMIGLYNSITLLNYNIMIPYREL